MRVVVVVVLDPALDGGESGLDIRTGIDPQVVALKGFDGGFGDAVAFRALDPLEAGDEIKRDCRVDGVRRGVG